MHRALLERRIRDVHARLVRAREDLAVLDEQLAVVMESADEARVRSLVAETPLAAHEHSEAARAALATTVTDLEHRQDELLADVASAS
jgi:hypothetical protein